MVVVVWGLGRAADVRSLGRQAHTGQQAATGHQQYPPHRQPSFTGWDTHNKGKEVDTIEGTRSPSQPLTINRTPEDTYNTRHHQGKAGVVGCLAPSPPHCPGPSPRHTQNGVGNTYKGIHCRGGAWW